MADKIITHPATPEYRDGYDRIFGKKRDKTDDGYTYATYKIDGAYRSPAMKAALAHSMQRTQE